MIFGFSVVPLAAGTETTSVTVDGRKARADRLIAQTKPGVMRAQVSGIADVRRFPELPRVVVLEMGRKMAVPAGVGPAGKTAGALAVKAEIQRLMATGQFEFVEPDYEVRALLAPTDASFTNGTLWGLRNTGQSGGSAGADIEAEEAWDVTQGSATVVVGVIDTGIRYTHQDLAANMWVNPGEIPNNGIDDDGNGYVDDVHGINAITGSGNPMDDNGHGSHVAGTIGAVANGGGPHVGVAWNVRLMALKFLSASGSGNTSDAIECINYGISNGAVILNNSWGGGGFSNALSSAITAALNNNVLFVAAAGNEGNNNDSNASYPANYPQANVISVAALDRNDALASFSNFGATTVDLGAPGVAIFSTTSTSNSSYSSFSGTSMAAPHVSGVAALVRALLPGISVAQLRERLLGTVRPIPALAGRMVYAGSVSANRALGTTSDGNLEISVSANPSPLVGGQAGVISVSVRDGLPVTGATVTGSLPGGAPLTFRDNGVAPDLAAGDALYTASVTAPGVGTSTTLTLQAAAPGKTPFVGTFPVSLVQTATNDNFANASVIPGAATVVTGSNVNATLQTGEPAHAGVVVGRSVWWTWTPSVPGSATITTSGSDFDTVLAVYTGTAVNSLRAVASNDDANDTLQSAVTFTAQAGVAYRIAVAGYDGESGAIRLNVPLAGGGVGAGPSFTTQPISRTVAAGQSVEFTVAVSSATTVDYEWRKDGAPLVDDGRITGSATPTLSIANVQEDDEANYNCVATNTVSSTPSELAFLAVDGAFVGPPNNDFNAAIELLGAESVGSGSNVNATSEPGEPDHAGVSGGKSAWWFWVAPVTGEAAVDTFGSTYDTTLAVYTGAAVGGLTEVAANDDAPDGGRQSEVRFFATEATTYRIAVDGYGSDAGNIQIAVRALTDNTPPRPRISVVKARRRADGTFVLAGSAVANRGLARIEVFHRGRWRPVVGLDRWRFDARVGFRQRRVTVRVRAFDAEGQKSRVRRITIRR